MFGHIQIERIIYDRLKELFMIFSKDYDTTELIATTGQLDIAKVFLTILLFHLEL